LSLPLAPLPPPGERSAGAVRQAAAVRCSRGEAGWRAVGGQQCYTAQHATEPHSAAGRNTGRKCYPASPAWPRPPCMAGPRLAAAAAPAGSPAALLQGEGVGSQHSHFSAFSAFPPLAAHWWAAPAGATLRSHWPEDRRAMYKLRHRAASRDLSPPSWPLALCRRLLPPLLPPFPPISLAIGAQPASSEQRA
jgi:hypothetical protein